MVSWTHGQADSYTRREEKKSEEGERGQEIVTKIREKLLFDLVIVTG